MNNFPAALKVVLKHEGGFTNDPDDHGGATNFGITQHDLAVHRGSPVTPDDVREMSLEEAGDIYFATYWAPFKLDYILSPTIATIIFDQGVLCGPHTVIKIAQRACLVFDDGIMGHKTLLAINALPSDEIATKILDLCEDRYKSIAAANHTQQKFLKGWLNRVADLRKLF